MFRKMGNEAYAGAVGAVVAVLVTIIVGVLVYYKIVGSISGIGTAGFTALGQVNTSATTVFTLAPIIGIVMIAGIVLAVVMGFGKAQV